VGLRALLQVSLDYLNGTPAAAPGAG